MAKIFVESISNHPYGNSMRMRGTRYELEDTDLDLMVKLRRVRPLSQEESEAAAQEYSTREMRAGIMTTRGVAPAPQGAPVAPDTPKVSRRRAVKPAPAAEGEQSSNDDQK